MRDLNPRLLGSKPSTLVHWVNDPCYIITDNLLPVNFLLVPPLRFELRVPLRCSLLRRVTLPICLWGHLVPRVGIEPTTPDSSDRCSTNWAILALFGSSYKVWTCDLHDVNVLLYHWAKELYLGCLTGIDPVLPLSQSRVQATTLKTP